MIFFQVRLLLANKSQVALQPPVSMAGNIAPGVEHADQVSCRPGLLVVMCLRRHIRSAPVRRIIEQPAIAALEIRNLHNGLLEVSHVPAAALIDVIDDPVPVVAVEVGLVHSRVLVLSFGGGACRLSTQTLMKFSVEFSSRRCRDRCGSRTCWMKSPRGISFHSRRCWAISRGIPSISRGIAIIRKHVVNRLSQLQRLHQSSGTNGGAFSTLSKLCLNGRRKGT